MTTPADRGFADPELLAVAERIYQARLSENTVFDLVSAAELEVLLGLVRTALDAVRAHPHPHLRGWVRLPGSWWIARNGDEEPAVWQPRPGSRPAMVITASLAGWRLWQVLYAALPDRGMCEECTADPCPRHVQDAP